MFVLRTVLTIGIILLLVGAFTVYNGPEVLTPIAAIFGLITPTAIETPILAPTLLNVEPGDYTDVIVHLEANVKTTGSFTVSGGREIALYVMDQGNFTRWQSGQPTAVVLAIPAASVENFTFSTRASDSYHFVFDNVDSSRRVVIFSLNLTRENIILHPVIEYLGYLLVVFGLILAIFGVRGGRERPKPAAVPVRTWACPFCGTENSVDDAFCSQCERARA
jgi:hypothetical protein